MPHASSAAWKAIRRTKPCGRYPASGLIDVGVGVLSHVPSPLNAGGPACLATLEIRG
jgi:hypothetical protein